MKVYPQTAPAATLPIYLFKTAAPVTVWMVTSKSIMSRHRHLCVCCVMPNAPLVM